ncbi:helix-turn-helix transcriptional regulator [Natrialba phage PhiCh1]|uniref:PadR family transcription regulator phiCh1-VP56 n=2 Tax=root TaxID=1 RepID=D3T2K0_NATMM|nr:helix-turn-helix transcriptional regulator [Natrialba magadii]NP_665974.1 helix-turn-helix transcriptional regulator [Natrialba phage PhiCh1]YP_010078082.1 helix-turn-helix transcriptional regulator [Natrialba phage PhiCh1]AAM88730.1 unknown [Natrialba phage PhiCh1]ADD07809.1 PadR family transcription regulator phiCh1-VP56 [Natrialba magadii ATCC 43099]ELY22962.1 PadR-like family transcriptional regulator [Natrialba magadii ATCC 43099]QBJ01233.1 transcriptional regulator, PadR-like family 
MRENNPNTVKLNEQRQSNLYGEVQNGRAVVRCGDCGTVFSATDAETHQCTEPEYIATDGGVNFQRDLTGFQRDIMFCLRRIERGKATEDQPYGLGIKRELERTRDVDVVNHGRLYPNLDELVEIGLIEKSMVDRRTNEYSTTNTGQQLVDDYSSWVLETVAERLPAAEAGGQQ